MSIFETKDDREQRKLMEANAKLIENLLLLPENKCCADCGMDEPIYCSIALGIFLCHRCAEIHHSFTRVDSRIRALLGLKWKGNKTEMFIKMGNRKSNAFYCVPPPENSSDSTLMQEYIQNKYAIPPGYKTRRIPDKEEIIHIHRLNILDDMIIEEAPNKSERRKSKVKEHENSVEDSAEKNRRRSSITAGLLGVFRRKE